MLDRLSLHILRDHIPLKQGLRPVVLAHTTANVFLLRDHIPLKQGLRQANW